MGEEVQSPAFVDYMYFNSVYLIPKRMLTGKTALKHN